MERVGNASPRNSPVPSAHSADANIGDGSLLSPALSSTRVWRRGGRGARGVLESAQGGCCDSGILKGAPGGTTGAAGEDDRAPHEGDEIIPQEKVRSTAWRLRGIRSASRRPGQAGRLCHPESGEKSRLDRVFPPRSIYGGQAPYRQEQSAIRNSQSAIRNPQSAIR
jgi:hypothetical protein